ncbi:MAG: AzlD domain-containing protein [Clostridia bacterium]|nr:AzlD domain-containing protein [Clostridia bacterium]
MNNNYLIIAIITISLATYMPRFLPIALIKSKIKNNFIKSMLIYMPYGVLSAMIFPAIIYSTGKIATGIAGSVVAIFLSYKKKGLLTVAITSILTVLLFEVIM